MLKVNGQRYYTLQAEFKADGGRAYLSHQAPQPFSFSWVGNDGCICTQKTLDDEASGVFAARQGKQSESVWLISLASILCRRSKQVAVLTFFLARVSFYGHWPACLCSKLSRQKPRGIRINDLQASRSCFRFPFFLFLFSGTCVPCTTSVTS